MAFGAYSRADVDARAGVPGARAARRLIAVRDAGGGRVRVRLGSGDGPAV